MLLSLLKLGQVTDTCMAKHIMIMCIFITGVRCQTAIGAAEFDKRQHTASQHNLISASKLEQNLIVMMLTVIPEHVI